MDTVTLKKRYLSAINIKEPTTGNNFTVTWQGNASTTEPTFSGNKGVVFYYANTTSGAKCVGEDVQAGNGSRSYAIAVGLEGGAVFCLDNQ